MNAVTKVIINEYFYNYYRINDFKPIWLHNTIQRYNTERQSDSPENISKEIIRNNKVIFV